MGVWSDRAQERSVVNAGDEAGHNRKHLHDGPGEMLSVRWPSDCNKMMWSNADGSNLSTTLVEAATEEKVRMWFRCRGSAEGRESQGSSGYTTYHITGPCSTVLDWYKTIRRHASEKRGTARGLPHQHQVFVQETFEDGPSKRSVDDPWLQTSGNRHFHNRQSHQEIDDENDMTSDDDEIINREELDTAIGRFDPGPEEPQPHDAVEEVPASSMPVSYPKSPEQKEPKRFAMLYSQATAFANVPRERFAYRSHVLTNAFAWCTIHMLPSDRFVFVHGRILAIH